MATNSSVNPSIPSGYEVAEEQRAEDMRWIGEQVVQQSVSVSVPIQRIKTRLQSKNTGWKIKYNEVVRLLEQARRDLHESQKTVEGQREKIVQLQQDIATLKTDIEATRETEGLDNEIFDDDIQVTDD